jgi:TIR domain-containing protein
LRRSAPGATLVSSALGELELSGDPGIELRDDSRLCAVIIALERPGLTDARYVEFLRWSLANVAKRADFRLYIAPHEVASAELMFAGLEVDDAVQRVGDLAGLCRSLAAFLQDLRTTRNAMAWRDLRLRVQYVGGFAAVVLQALCLLVSVLLVFWLPVWNVHASLREYVGLEWLAALVCGVASVPFLSVLLYVFSRHGIPPVGMWRDRSVVLWGFVASFLGPHTLGVPIRLRAPAGYILLGIAIGALLDAARRRKYGAQRERREVDPDAVAGRHGRLAPALRRQAGRSWINPWRCPLLPVKNARVFISYARESEWARRSADELEAELSSVGATFFRDTAIPPGGAWRRELNEHLGRATVVVALADDAGVTRAWPAAELEAALAGRALTGSPDIIVVRSSDLPRRSEDWWRWLPVFKQILAENEHQAETGPEVVEDSAAMPKAIAYKLHPRSYRSISVLPRWLARLLGTLWAGPRLALQLWGSIGALYGILALLARLHFLDQAEAMAGLLDEGWTLPELAAYLGKPLSWTARRHRLCTLAPGWRRLAERPEGWCAAWSAADFEQIALLVPAAQQDLLLRGRPRLERCATPHELAQLIRSLAQDVATFPGTPATPGSTRPPAPVPPVPIAAAGIPCSSTARSPPPSPATRDRRDTRPRAGPPTAASIRSAPRRRPGSTSSGGSPPWRPGTRGSCCSRKARLRTTFPAPCGPGR